ncbi:hypothetical protein MY1884_008452 [Beauveria asiatica]
MASPGILYVTMQPRPGLPLAQFHEWYNNEHGPTRLSLPSIFANGFRYQSASPTTTTTTTTTSSSSSSSSSSPAFLAVYDIHHMPLLATPTYTTLRAHRSPREAATIAQVHVRRSFYDLLHTAAAPDFQPIESLSDRDAVGLVTVAVEISPASNLPAAGDAYQTWYVEEHVGMLAKVPGWRRSRLFKTSSSLQQGAGDDADNETPTYLCLHDYAPDNGLGGAEHKASVDTPRRTAVFQKHVARKSRQTYSLFYVFGPASRDLYSLSQLDGGPSSASFTSPSGTLQTSATSIASRVTTPSGLAIRYRLQGNPSPSAPVIVFSNSLLTSCAMWDPLVTLLQQHRPDLCILRYDTRGRHSLAQPPVAATLADLASDLDVLRAALRIDRFACLVGVSMGAATALRYALTYPTRLARFVAADCNAASSAANTQAWRDRIDVARGGGGGMAALAGQTVARWFHPETRDETVAWMTDMVAENDVEGFAHSCTALWDYDLREELPRCAVPGLLVAGEADGKGALVKAMESFKGLVGQEGAALHVVPRAGHLPMCENPQGFWDAIKDFI